jgi:hypothetical protein
LLLLVLVVVVVTLVVAVELVVIAHLCQEKTLVEEAPQNQL